MSALLFSLFQTVGGWRRSPSSRSSSRAESSEDLLSDTASVASDISDSSLNSSLLGKRTLVPPTKVTHLFKTDSARFIREMWSSWLCFYVYHHWHPDMVWRYLIVFSPSGGCEEPVRCESSAPSEQEGDGQEEHVVILVLSVKLQLKPIYLPC